MMRLMLAALWAMLLVFWLSPAWAHSWYEWACCSDQDCAPMGPDEYSFDDGHIVIHATGERIPLEDTQPSLDGQFHRCVYLNGSREGQTRPHLQNEGMCIYVPQMF